MVRIEAIFVGEPKNITDEKGTWQAILSGLRKTCRSFRCTTIWKVNADKWFVPDYPSVVPRGNEPQIARAELYFGTVVHPHLYPNAVGRTLNKLPESNATYAGGRRRIPHQNAIVERPPQLVSARPMARASKK